MSSTLLISSARLSEQELSDELAKISDALILRSTSATSTTQERDGAEVRAAALHALHQLQRFGEENISERLSFIKWMKEHLKMVLVNAFDSNWPTLVCAACLTAASMARCSTNKRLWIILCSWVTPLLLGCTASTTPAVAEAAQVTLDEIALHNGFSAEAFGVLLKTCQAGHRGMRQHAMTTVVRVLQTVKGTPQQVPLLQFTTPLLRVVGGALRDADETVRMLGRRGYWAMYAMEPMAAATLFASFTPAEQRRIEGERQDSLKELRVMPSAASPIRGSPSSSPLAVPVPHNISTEWQLQEELCAVAAEKARIASKTRRLTSSSGRSGSRRGPPWKKVEATHAELGSIPLTEEEWEALAKALVDPGWAHRLAALERLQASLAWAIEEGGELEHVPLRQACVLELVHRVSDPHFRVSTVAVQLLSSVVTQNPSVCAPHVQELVPALVGHANGPKQPLAELSEQLLQRISKHVDGATLVPALMRSMLHHTTPHVRMGLVQLFLQVIEQQQELFLDPAVMRTSVKSLMTLLQEFTAKDDASPLRMAIVLALRSLSVAAGKTFLVCANSMEEPLQRKMLLDLVDNDHSSQAVTSTESAILPRSCTERLPSGTREINEQQQMEAISCNASPRVHTSPRKFLGVCDPNCQSAARSAAKQSSPPPRAGSLFTSRLSPDRFYDPHDPTRMLFGAARLAKSASLEEPPRLLESIEALLQQLQVSYVNTETKCRLLDDLRRSFDLRSESWNEAHARLLLSSLDDLLLESREPSHYVRLRAFTVLRALLDTSSLLSTAARQLGRLLLWCRAGLDDSFPEVHQVAAIAMHAALVEGRMPLDLRLNALASALEKWQHGPFAHDQSSGWMEVLKSVGRALEQRSTKRGGTSKWEHLVTESVLRRVTTVVYTCIDHAAPAVRQTSALILAVMWHALGEEVLPFFSSLTPRQQRLVTLTYNSAFEGRQRGRPATLQYTQRDLSEELAALRTQASA